MRKRQASGITVEEVASYLGHTKNRIRKVGVELEGGWDEKPTGGELIRDGSVQVLAQYGGELPSKPMEVSEIGEWMIANYPTVVNKSCGLHVHMSFGTTRLGKARYQCLMDPQFSPIMVQLIGKWAKRVALLADDPLWERLKGKNCYCSPQFCADAQAKQAKKSYSHGGTATRYTMVNYCYGLHGTVECRLLGMLPTSELAVSAVHAVLSITNAFLVATAFRAPMIDVVHVIDTGAIIEEFSETV